MNSYLKYFSFILLIIGTFHSCDEVEELATFDITQDFNTTINVNLPEDSQGQPQSWSQSSSIDIASNEVVQENLDRIEDVTVNSLSFQISNFSGPADATVTDATLSFDNTVINLDPILLEEADANNTVFVVGDATTYDAIAQYLEDNQVISPVINATVSSTPVVFDVIINLDVTFTAEGL